MVLSGVESVGKTWLSMRLAALLGAEVVPEVGRSYTEALDRPLTLADHHAIAAEHARLAEAAAARQPRLLVEDTDIVMTTSWATMLFGERDPLLAAMPSRADLHLLLLPDLPFVPDPVRMFGDPASRARFHAVVEAEFAARGLEPLRIGGSLAGRETAAIAAIERRLP